MGFWGNVWKGVKKGIGSIKDGVISTLGDKDSILGKLVEDGLPMGLGRVVTGVARAVNSGKSLG